MSILDRNDSKKRKLSPIRKFYFDDQVLHFHTIFLFGSGNHSKKRQRYDYTASQVAMLENHYKESPYISTMNRRKLSQEFGLHEIQIKIWFQNRRMKTKRANSLSSTEAAHYKKIKGRMLKKSCEFLSPSPCESPLTYTSTSSQPNQWVHFNESGNFTSMMDMSAFESVDQNDSIKRELSPIRKIHFDGYVFHF